MTGYELSADQMMLLVRSASRHHRTQIAGWISLTVHTRNGEPYFRNAEGGEVGIVDVCRLLQTDERIQRQAYHLFMHYSHFG